MDAFARIEAAAARRPELGAWVDRIRALGVAKRLAGGDPVRAREMLDALASVTAALPARGGESLNAFAARVTGRAHALDDGSPLGTLALGPPAHWPAWRHRGRTSRPPRHGARPGRQSACSATSSRAWC